MTILILKKLNYDWVEILKISIPVSLIDCALSKYLPP